MRPVVNAYINFSTGPSFAQTLLLGSGLLGTNVLGDSAAVIVDVSDQIDGITTKRGRNAASDQFQTGTCTLRIVDETGDFNPQNTAGPYFGLLDPMRKLQITATYEGIEYPIFSGFITGYTTVTPLLVGDVVYTTITAVDAFRLAQNAQIATVTGATAHQLSGDRVNLILDEISWPESMRDVDPGLTYLQDDSGEARTSLAALQTCSTSEYGAFYVDAAGSFVMQDRSVTAGSVAGTPVDFNDDGTGIRYANAVWVLNDVLIYNEANVTRTGGTTQTTSDAASIEKYFLHSYNQQNLLMETDAEALDYARSYVASRKDTTVRCDAIVLDLDSENYNDGIIAGLGLDYFDPVTITTNQPGSSALTKTLQIFGVAMTITPRDWRVTFTTLEPILDSFILNTDYGILGTNVLSY